MKKNLRRAFELQSTTKWNTFSSTQKAAFLNKANNNMDAAKDIAFMTYLNMPTKKKEFEVKLKMYVNIS